MDLTIYNDVPSDMPGTYCRFCFRETSLVPLFHPTTSEPLNLELISIITDCTGILLKPEIDFPSAACQSCLQLMQEFQHFRRRAREYDKIIRSRILPRIEPEVIIVKQEELDDNAAFDCEPERDSTSSSTLTADESRDDQVDILGRLRQLHQQHQHQLQQLQEQQDGQQMPPNLLANEEQEPKFSMSAIFSATAAVAAVAAAASTKTHSRGISRRSQALGASGSQGPEENRCMVCGEKFQSRDVWMAHLTVHAIERPFQCHICLAQFKTKYVQQNHIRTVHENVRSYRCPICTEPSRMFKSKRTLEDHMRYHTGERPFVCSICKMSFSSGSVHRNHMYRVHREMRKKDRRCSFCSKVFDRILDLKRHQTSYCEKIIGHGMVQRL
ncbi:zinc finger and SCAN domain-containing protein 5C-like [Anopheles cruzii]|uniref:zinc finger and SCAN domain-containing protein 5C-like n=1 Tax=Anopheles cruzii TaxID=68878 RepID=UPI0022EC3B1D|nr:zinc finger and SCAN domain-containing protein 5C-like [Anopheles cruzii]